MQKILITLLLLGLVTRLSAQSSAIDSLDKAFARLAEDGYLSGNLLLAEGDQILLRRSYGYADFDGKVPLREDAVLELASVSKQFTAAAVALLVADGELDLDTPVAEYLPELAAYPDLTTRHLVHHTGGLPDYMAAAGELEDLPEFITNTFVLEYLRDVRPAAEFSPGERFAYSNTGYVLLASLIERVSGRAFDEFLRERLFEPLGMEDSQVYRRRYEAERTVNRFVPGYVWDGEGYVIPDSLEEYAFVRTLDGVYGDGMVNSTLDDLYRWDRALAAGELLDTALLFRPGITATGDTTTYGFGQGIGQHPDYGYTISHSGGWPGVVTHIYRFPHSDRVLILLRNDGGGRDERVNPLRNALRALHGLPLEPESLAPTRAGTVDPAAVKELEGVYAVSPAFKLTFFLAEDGRFMTQATGQPAFEIGKHSTADRYMLLKIAAELQFQRNAAGKVTSVMLYQGGQEIEAVREE
ncbi:serine hydrolase domain-containing protein [Lewinella sp. IMCC34183]|uniref:serine hydrolase domain-containing protein n=1 Tax=Lewinella sp. IMCC34183 TaxID=2248762 RepID=UPI000E248836|nr:serine hydrolase domain-containing protein [Lewinella sp. IMCC34183]